MALVGDIVKATDDSPYAITKGDSKWAVYGIQKDPQGAPILQIGSVPESHEEFNRRLGFLSDSFRDRKMRLDLNMKLFHVQPRYFNVVGQIATNKKYAVLLKQGDIWEEPKPKTRKRGSAYDDFDIPF